jgi:hypothetical protein
LLFATGVQWAMVVNALSYVVSYFAIRAVRVTKPSIADVARPVAAGIRATIRAIRQEFTAGLRFFVHNRFLVVLLTIAAVIGALLAGTLVARVGARRLSWLCLVVAGVFVVVYSRQSHFLSGVPTSELASMLSVVAAGWLASTALRGFDGHIGGLRFGPIDTIFAVSGVLIVLAGSYAGVALPRDTVEPVEADPAVVS